LSKQETNDSKDKLRVYEYAKSLNMSSKEIITILKRQNMPVNNHMSVMEPAMVEAVEKFFHDVKANAAAKMAQSAAKQQQKSQAASVQAAQSARSPEDTQAKPAVSVAESSGRQEAKPQGQGAGGTRLQSHNPAVKPAANKDGGRPQGQGEQGVQHAGKPQGQGNQGGQSGSRPQGQGGQAGGKTHGQGNQAGQVASRPQGQGGHAGQGGGRPQGGNRPQGNQGGGFGGGRNQGQGGPGSARIVVPPIVIPQTASRGGRSGENGRPGTRGGESGKGRDNYMREGKRKDLDYSKRFEDGRINFKNKIKGGKNGKGRNNQPPREKIDNTPKKVIVRGEMTVGELAKLLHKDASEVIKKLMMMGMMVTINQDLDLDTVLLVASEFGVETEVKIVVEDTNFETMEENDDPDLLEPRAPVVTIMGHVDHGKTTLLDAIRESKVAMGEAGGITQHIGAYQVEVNGKKITFLDTPGHEAFTVMRSRGAQVTDITILVVAADDGVMPTTVEAINHAKAANVPIIVAVNKIDKPTANPDRVKQELMEYGLVPEAWGGDTIYVEISAKQRKNLDELLEMILLVAEVNDYRAVVDKRARGTVLEAELDKGKGPVARVLVQNGTLKVGDAFVAGDCFGRIRAMTNDRGRRIKEAGPSTPVEITGLTEVPQAGDPFMVFEDERKAREIAEKRAIKTRQEMMKSHNKVTLDDLFNKIKEGEIKDLNVIIKADVQGSVEALRGALEKIEVEGVRVKTIHAGVGAITESDILLASASSAIVIGFNVVADPRAAATAEQEKVDVRLHRIIYKVIEEIEQSMKGMLEPVYKEKVVGHAEIRETFKVSKVGTIAGCLVTDGKILRQAQARLIRDGKIIYEGKIDSLKRFKDDVREVTEGYECGITLEKFNDLQQGDVIEAFIMESEES
jgi:translation initiation factor IF-2